jgi:hypothetical protein
LGKVKKERERELSESLAANFIFGLTFFILLPTNDELYSRLHTK